MINVQCPSCKGIYHELTDEFDPDRQPNGTMFKAKKTIDKSWWSFPETPSTGPGGLECPSCGSLYTGGNGKLIANLIEVEDLEDKDLQQQNQEPPSGDEKPIKGEETISVEFNPHQNQPINDDKSKDTPPNEKPKQAPKKGSIPEDKNPTILLMAEQGASATEIGKTIGASRQAVGARLKQLRENAE